MLDVSSRRAVRIAAVLGLCTALAGVAQAATITYTLRGIASGTLGAQGFANAPFVLTATGDTATVTALGPGVPCNDTHRATFRIEGAGDGAITTALSVADNSAWALLAIARGSCAASGPMWTNGRNPRLEGYDLVTALPPMALTMPSAPPGIAVDTSQGPLAFRSVSALQFEARLAGPVTVPTLSGLGLGVLVVSMAGVGAAAVGRRRGPLTVRSGNRIRRPT